MCAKYIRGSKSVDGTGMKKKEPKRERNMLKLKRRKYRRGGCQLPMYP
jgi:hypothetical protein